MRATVEKQHGTSTPPIVATIAAGDNNVCIRISDQGWFPFLAIFTIPLNVLVINQEVAYSVLNTT
jgi:hypothetical protein